MNIRHSINPAQMIPAIIPRAFLLAAIFFAFPHPASADVKLPAIISDHMVLQKSAKVPIWGKADPGEEVTVTIDGKTAKATAGPDGRWRVKLEGLQPGVAGDMTVSGKNSLIVRDVVVGDVWVCSGQSNMEMPLKATWISQGGVLDFEQEIAAANYPKIRMFTVPKKASEIPLEDVAGKWEICAPETVPGWSATGYFFGRQLHQDLGIPIGLIHSSWGGTMAQAWTPSEVLQGTPEFKTAYYDKRQAELANYPALKAKYEKETLPAWQASADVAKAAGKPVPIKPRGPVGPGMGPAASTLYNGMIAGATKYPIKGAIWYQGESNAIDNDSERYRRLLPAMITSWRKAWAQPDFPFYIVQLANFMAPRPDPADSKWANLRDAQRLTALNLPNTGLAVAIDIGEGNNIHPRNKQEVGRRLALVAEAKSYGKNTVCSGPSFDSAKFDGASATVIFEAGTALGLTAKDTGSVKGFALAGEDQKFVWADAKIASPRHDQGNEPVIVLSAPGVAHPVAVRYAWANNPEVNLVNKANLPAVPFRTDDWPQVETPAPHAQPTAPAAAGRSNP
ncbi:MAG: sialate O-acetylesterase [Verrucomicrobiaceae bacterium]|nr:MAG: sialate O-acetylesterase [Verrucomicrobiaceae bacterium]